MYCSFSLALADYSFFNTPHVHPPFVRLHLFMIALLVSLLRHSMEHTTTIMSMERISMIIRLEKFLKAVGTPYLK